MRRTFFQSKIHRAVTHEPPWVLVDARTRLVSRDVAEVAGPARRAMA